MDRNEVESKAKKIVVEMLGVEEDKITSDSKWDDDLRADSLDLVELIMSFEVEFDIEVPDDVADRWATFGQAVDGITAMVNAEG